MARERDDEPTSVTEILDMEPSSGKDNKSWIGGPFEAVIKRPKKIEPQGRNYCFFTCNMHDPTNDRMHIKATSDVDFVALDGEMVEVSGNGISREEWKKGTDYPRKGDGVPEIKMGSNASVQVIGSAPKARTESRSDNRAPARTTAKVADKAERTPYGPAVGGSIEQANTAILAMPDHPAPGTPEFAHLILEVASDFLRVNEYMENGGLAPTAKDRANPEAAKERAAKANEAKAKAIAEEKAKAEAQEAARRAADKESNQGGEEDLDDDIPF